MHCRVLEVVWNVCVLKCVRDGWDAFETDERKIDTNINEAVYKSILNSSFPSALARNMIDIRMLKKYDYLCSSNISWRYKGMKKIDACNIWIVRQLSNKRNCYYLIYFRMFDNGLSAEILHRWKQFFFILFIFTYI